MATDPQTLLNEARCYECNTSGNYDLELIKIALLRQILLAANPTAMTDPQTLLNSARCYECYGANGYMLQLMELALLSQIATSSSSSAGAVSCGTGAPSAAPAGGCGVYIQTDSVPAGLIWEYYSGAWH